MASPTSAFGRNRQFLLYCAIGLLGVTLDFVLYTGLLELAGLHHQVANAAGYGSGTLLSFTLNARFNFKKQDWLLLRLLSFCAVGLLGWAVSAGLLLLMIDRLAWNKLLAKLAAIAVVVLLQYNFNRLVSFRSARRD
jgi:putative flippase GtrA